MSIQGQLHGIKRALDGSYKDVVPLSELGLDIEYLPVFSAVEFRTAGTFSFINVYDQERTIEVDTGRIYPIQFKKVVSANTTIIASDIYGYKDIWEI